MEEEGVCLRGCGLGGGGIAEEELVDEHKLIPRCAAATFARCA